MSKQLRKPRLYSFDELMEWINKHRMNERLMTPNPDLREIANYHEAIGYEFALDQLQVFLEGKNV